MHMLLEPQNEMCIRTTTPPPAYCVVARERTITLRKSDLMSFMLVPGHCARTMFTRVGAFNHARVLSGIACMQQLEPIGLYRVRFHCAIHFG